MNQYVYKFILKNFLWLIIRTQVRVHAKSLDLNPMEHFWAFLKRCLNEFSTPLQGIEELWECVCIVSSNFSKEDCMTLYESMPQRIA